MNLIMLLLAVMAILSTTLANSVTFLNWSKRHLNIIFTPSEKCYRCGIFYEWLPDVRVNGQDQIRINIPNSWQGNWKAHKEGVPRDTRSILGEVKFQGFEGKTYYDVSAVDNYCNPNGTKFLTGWTDRSKNSGCSVFPSGNSYTKPDDVQTKVTWDTDLLCVLAAWQ